MRLAPQTSSYPSGDEADRLLLEPTFDANKHGGYRRVQLEDALAPTLPFNDGHWPRSIPPPIAYSDRYPPMDTPGVTCPPWRSAPRR